ncbi:MAG: selenide, water dikinase SelD [Acidobacteriota bacterium]
MGQDDLRLIMSRIKEEADPNLIVGFATADDAAVYKIKDDLAIVQTLDFITPVVDDPYIFGQIAASNSLSDVYAMGGKPLTAMNICCFPPRGIAKEALARILEGGHKKIKEAGASLVGGHTIEDQDLKYGLSVTGVIDPSRVISNMNARPGDRIILTKPLGTALYISAFRAGRITESQFSEAVESMIFLNKTASEIMLGYDVSACTDVTGFALAGHLLDVVDASHVGVEVSFSSLPLFEMSNDLAREGFSTRLTKNNKETQSRRLIIDAGLAENEEAVLYDPQTSGGLLIFIREDQAEGAMSELNRAGIFTASIIGIVTGKADTSIRIIP